MSNTYCVFPLNEECTTWLKSEGISFPPLSPSNRNPTPAEIEEVLAKLEGYTFKVSRNLSRNTWYADVSSIVDTANRPWAEITVLDYRSDDDPHSFSFTNGWQESILLVTERLTHICGPLVMADGSDGRPYLITPGMDLGKMVRGYNSR